jgi:TolB-like protein
MIARALTTTLALAAAQPAFADDGAPANIEHKPKLLVLDFRDDGVGPNIVRIVHDTLAAHVSRDDRLEVVSSEDMRRALDVESQKRALGCDEESCLAEIAEALGAQLTIYGTVGKLGELVIVNVSLYDARASRSVGRETIESRSLEGLPAALRAAGDRLVARLPGFAPQAPPPSAFPGPLFLTGTVVGGAGLLTGAAAGLVALLSAAAVAERPTFQEKTEAKTAQDVATNVAVAGFVAAAVGVLLVPIALFLE